MLEYASILLMLVWDIATTLPMSIESIASADIISVQSGWMAGKATVKTRRKAAKPAAFGPTDMNAVTDVGAPSYTSGAHMWKGTAATLNPNPATSSIIASMSAGLLYTPAPMNAAISLRLVVPVTPKVIAMP